MFAAVNNRKVKFAKLCKYLQIHDMCHEFRVTRAEKFITGFEEEMKYH